MQQQQNGDHKDAISLLSYRIDNMERNVAQLSTQLANYVPVRENDLKLSSIQDIVRRIEGDVNAVKGQVVTLNDQIFSQRESQDKLQIRTLYGIVATIVSVATAILVGYITHFFR